MNLEARRRNQEPPHWPPEESSASSRPTEVVAVMGAEPNTDSDALIQVVAGQAAVLGSEAALNLAFGPVPGWLWWT